MPDFPPTPAPTPPPGKDLPPWAKYLATALLSALVAFLSSRYGIAPTPPVVQVHAPDPATAASVVVKTFP